MRCSGRRLPPILIAALLLLAACGVLNTLRIQGQVGGTFSSVQPRTDLPSIHVVLCSDDKDLRPTAVAIRSAAVSAAQPERLVFHFVTTPEFGSDAKKLFEENVPGVNIQVHHNEHMDAQLSHLISWRKTSKSRRVLASPFNFAPFYLDYYLAEPGQERSDIRRLIYLDTDTLVLGDLAELYDMDLQGHTCAAVPYCLQRFEDYINFEVLAELGFEGVYDPKSCIANRGILIIDTALWKQKNITGRVEDWMVRYRNAERDLWMGGMSQPPWLLAMNGDYLHLGDDWNCNSLGRDSMSMWESVILRRSGFDHKALRILGVKLGMYGSIQPYVVTCSSKAKLLHYNGDMKPWVADRLRRGSPVCAVPESLDHKWTWNRSVRVYCEHISFVTCNEVWSLFITPGAGARLRDPESEWSEEERRWADQKREDREKAEKDRREREKKTNEGQKAREEQEKADQEAREKERLEQEKLDKEREKLEKEKKEKDKKKKKKQQEKKAEQEKQSKESPSQAQGALGHGAGHVAMGAPGTPTPHTAQKSIDEMAVWRRTVGRLITD